MALAQYNSNQFKSVIESLKIDGEKSDFLQLNLETIPDYNYNLL